MNETPGVNRPDSLRTMFLPEDKETVLLPSWADNLQPTGCLSCKRAYWMENSYFLGKTYSCPHIFTNHECNGTFSGACYKYFKDKEIIKTRGGVPIANGYARVIHGGRGDYVEFTDTQIIHESLHPIPGNTHEKNKFYDEYRTKDGMKVYHQFGFVHYANYKPGMWYISPADLLDFTFPKEPMKLDSSIDKKDPKELLDIMREDVPLLWLTRQTLPDDCRANPIINEIMQRIDDLNTKVRPFMED